MRRFMKVSIPNSSSLRYLTYDPIGDFKNNLYDGQGKLTLTNVLTYTGEFSEGEFHGEGVIQKPDGTTTAAIFNNGEIVKELQEVEEEDQD